MVAESRRLEPMLAQVLAYGSDHRDEFGTYGLVWQNGSDASVLISFTGDLDAHRSALARLVEYPDELIVCQAALSGEANQALQAELGTEFAGRFSSIGQGFGAVIVKLPATAERFAAELNARYGDSVSITVGNFAYPLPLDPRPGNSQCATSVRGPTDLNGLRATLSLTKSSVGVDEEISGTVTITNTGDQPATFSSGSPLVAAIVRPGTAEVVGVYDRGIAGVGDGATLQPGESHIIPVVAATASCDARLGFVLPPGQYEIIAPVVVTNPQQSGAAPINQLITSAAALTVTS